MVNGWNIHSISSRACLKIKAATPTATILLDGFLWRRGVDLCAMDTTHTAPAAEIPPGNIRPMEARFHRPPQIALAIACWGIAALIVWFWIRGLDTGGWQPVVTRAVVSGLAAATALFFVLGVVFLRAAFLVRPLALVIDDRGIWFGLPDIALIPWSRVLRTEFFDMGGRRRFGVVTIGPTPRMRVSRGRKAIYAWDPVEDGIRISVLIDRLDIKEEQISRTVRWFAPPVMRVTSLAPAS